MKAKAVSKEATQKLRYLPQRLNTVQNVLISTLCLIKEGDVEGALATLRESHEYLKTIIRDVEEVLRELESS